MPLIQDVLIVDSAKNVKCLTEIFPCRNIYCCNGLSTVRNDSPWDDSDTGEYGPEIRKVRGVVNSVERRDRIQRRGWAAIFESKSNLIGFAQLEGTKQLHIRNSYPWSLAQYQSLFSDVGALRGGISSFAHGYPLLVGDDAVSNDCQESQDLKSKLPFLKMVIALAIGIVGIYRGLWNMKFGSQGWRDWIMLFVGIVVYVRGCSSFLMWSLC